MAQLLGVHRHTVGHWLAIYEARGLEGLLDLYVPAGKPLSLPPGVLAALEQALRHPTGFASYEALRQWVKQQHRLDVNYHTLYTIVRTKLKAKNLDLIVVNPVGGPDTGFASDTNRASIIDAAGAVQEIPLMSKAQMADAILDRVAALLGK